MENAVSANDSDCNGSMVMNASSAEDILAEINKLLYFRNYVVMVLYAPVFVIALTANILIIAVVIKYHYMRSVTNYFLVNLAVADLLVTVVCMPTAAWFAYCRIWYLGELLCIVTKFLQCVAVAASVFTITAMALDRYLAITQPFGITHCFSFNRRTGVVIIVFIWITSMVVFFPMVLVTTTDTMDLDFDNYTFCGETQWGWMDKYYPRRVFGIVSFCIMFAIPGCLMLFAYGMMGRKLCIVRPPFDNNEGSISTQQSYRLVRERKRVAWILLLLALIFAICWLPYNSMTMYMDVTDRSIDNYLLQYMLLLGHLNSALNPIIYCIMSKNFRRSASDFIFKTRINFQVRQNHRLRCNNSSGSSQGLYLQKLYAPPILHNHNALHSTLSKLQSSQRTTKTCAV